MTADGWLAVAVRFGHLAALAVGAGSLACLALVVRPVLSASDRERLDRTALRLARWALAAAVATMGLDLLVRLAAASGRPLGEALAAGLLRPLLADTWYGRVTGGRAVLAGLLGVLLALAPAARWARHPWLAGAAATLAAGLLATAPLAGHVIAADSAALRLWQATAGVLHALAAGVWLGALPLLALALRRAASAQDAARLARRFSALGVTAVGLLVAAGVASAYALVGGVPALVGTPYGRLLLAKVALLVPVLAIAAGNLLRRPPRLVRRVVLEAALGAAILLVAAVLATTPPARHVEPVWPFAGRLTWTVLALAPSLESRVLTGACLALLGVSALVYAALFPRQRLVALVAGGAGLAAAWLAVWPLRGVLVIDAYPTTYARPAVPYHVTSLASGLDLYATHCAGCHGPTGRGDGPGARAFPIPPADLTASHARDHTAGDLYWWIGNGIRRPGRPPMPAYGGALDDEGRWDLVNVVRLLSDAAAARALGLEPAGTATIVAPDFVHPALPGRLSTLRSARGRVVLLVLPGPDSADRLARLAQATPRVAAAGGLVVVARPEDPPEVPAVYGRFRRPEDPSGHVEFLIDRQGYLRARWDRGQGDGWDEEDRLVGLVGRLATEPPAAPPAEAHVH